MKNHIVKVEGELYQRYNEGPPRRFRRTYRGKDLVKILKHVDEEHGYGYTIEDDNATVEGILQSIEANMDGADWISKLTIDGEVKIQLQDEDVGEETVE